MLDIVVTPSIARYSYNIYEWGNTIPEYGQEIGIEFIVKNIGLETANNLTFTITTDDLYTNYTDTIIEYPSLLPDYSIGLEGFYYLEFSE